MRLTGLFTFALFIAASQAPSPAQAFGDDTYRLSHQCTGSLTGDCRGNETLGLTCSALPNGGRSCTGYLASFDRTTTLPGTNLHVTVMVPPGAGPHPLVVSLHGWGGSKDGQGYIADPFFNAGYAVLRYSARGFGKSWGQVNLADVHVELEDLRSMIGQVVDMPDLGLNPDAVGIIGVSYGGGQTWLSLTLMRPTFTSPNGTPVAIRAVAPIVPWSDLLYSLAPNGRPENSLSPLGSPKASMLNALYVAGERQDLERPYPNYPDYLIKWHTWINTVEPNETDLVYQEIRDGLAGYRSIWWQEEAFWKSAVAARVPVFQVQGLPDDLFPLPEAKRMLLRLKASDANYPIASYFGDIGHPRAGNKTAERDYALGLILQWFDYYVRRIGSTAPPAVVRAAITRPRDQAFNPADVITVASYDALATGTVAKSFPGSATLINPLSDPAPGFCWDPLFMEAWSTVIVCPPPPEPAIVAESLGVFKVPVAELSRGGSLLIAGQPAVRFTAATTGPRVQLNVRLIDIAPGGTKQLITRGTFILEQSGTAEVVVPTYGNVWEAPVNHLLQLEISNVDSPYLKPSLLSSVTTISNVRLELPVRQ